MSRQDSGRAGSDSGLRLYDRFARVARALASGRRLELLAPRARTVVDLAVEPRMLFAKTSQQLQVLRSAGLVAPTRSG